ncbi:uncharacterized protein CANTADRAFT_44690 [Suhomyces tanzawaensis NRRL Y-17324]|uniref:Cullin family profile domain-containing protein n=1 Tax=Suhomyces tanzawaensis NRRL Y-17324 TaxID=984487 RepID=A0A1E4SPG5_9ASCO|nr:uncharacterized protein CANTADRAFT_44690 [Suhomyces tanzawaensis NRRL Y-17324]ODV81378.1 hypothetical protein CANTADRAFT_44690 [Suhomyces tanzawaensis NRRL Y-17324]
MDPLKAPQSAFSFTAAEPIRNTLEQPTSLVSAAIDDSKKRQKPEDDLEFVDSMGAFIQESRSTLSELVDLILANLPLKRSYHTYTTLVESHCRLKSDERSKLTQMIYEKLDKHYQDHTKLEIANILESMWDNSQTIIEKCLVVFEDWESKLKLIRKLFLYLDRSYLLNHATKSQILNYGMDLLINDVFIDNHRYRMILLKLHTDILAEYRQRDEEYPQFIKDFTKAILKFNYTRTFTAYLDTVLVDLIIAQFNTLKVTWWENPEDYLAIVVRRASREKEYYRECGYSSKSINNLILRLHWILIFEDFKTFISSVLPYLVEPEYHYRLRLVYSWSESSKRAFALDSMPIFVLEWGQMISNKVLKIIDSNKTQLPKFLVHELVDLFTKFNGIVGECLNGNEKFEFELRSSFTNAFNKRPNNNFVILQLAKYCDNYFKASSKKTSSDIPFEEFKSNVLVIFKCINNKQDFLIPYKKDLSRRLLLARNSNFDQEKQLADSIMDLVGAFDSNGLDALFTDFITSRDSYSSILESDVIEFNPLVLDKSKWPDIPKLETEAAIPSQLSSILDSFSTKYLELNERHKSQKLDWSNYSLHQLTIHGEFEKGVKELSVNLLQAVVILLFNDADSYLFKQIRQKTNMETKLLTRILTSLTTERYKILIRNDDMYNYNYQFTDKSYRIRIPLAKDTTTKAAKRGGEIVQEIEKNRKEEFSSVLMKIMKQFKELAVSELFGKAIDILEKRNPVSIVDLKESLEQLINREYILRVTTEKVRYIP